jgi:hypothetical protein
MSCSVCCEQFTHVLRRKVPCSGCDYDVCCKCAAQYILSTVQDPHCMNCRKAWDREYIGTTMPKCFLNVDLRRHRENVLLDRERSLLPATQAAAEREKQIRARRDVVNEMRDHVKAFLPAFEETEIHKQTEQRLKQFEEKLRDCVYAQEHIIPVMDSRTSLKIARYGPLKMSNVLLFFEENTPLRMKCYFKRSYQINYANSTEAKQYTHYCHGYCGYGKGLCNYCGNTKCTKCGIYLGKSTAATSKDAVNKTNAMTHHECKNADKQKYQKLLDLMAEYEQFKDGMLKTFNESWAHVQRNIYQGNRTVHRALRNVQNLDIDIANPIEGEASSSSAPARTIHFIKACPAPDCRGFLSTQWKCGLCGIFVCSKCHEIKGLLHDTNHECNPDMVETAKLLAKEVKPCPSCASLIYKVNGCDQMWCTQCQTPFSWSSGKVVKGTIHNPHYFEFVRTNTDVAPRTIGDIPCGGLPDIREINQACKNLFGNRALTVAQKKELENLTGYMSVVFRCIAEVPAYLQQHRVDDIQDNEDLRVKYLLKDIDDKKFKQQLQIREKRNDKKRSFYQVYDMVQMAGAMVLQRFVQSPFPTIKVELENLRDYTNNCFRKLAILYQCRMNSISNEWRWQ